MKLLSKKREQGSILVVTLFTGLAIGIVLASYLTLISSRYNLTARSMGWNAAMPVLEAGIEEALTHLHDDSNSPSANGWMSGTINGLQVYTKERHFTDGSKFYVTIYNATANNPWIYSQGFVPSPLHTDQYISRTVRVGASNTPSIFTMPIAATGPITLSGGVVDGFDSSLGGYDTSTNRNATGSIATDSTNKPAVNVGTAHVYGTVITGPGGTVPVNGGAVGDVAWNASNSGIEPGWTNNTMNVAFPSNAPPSGGPYPAPTVTVVGVSNITYLATGKYEMSTFTSSDYKKPMIVTGNATLWVTGDLTVSGSGSGSGYILVNPGASLTLIVGGKVTVSGGGVVNGTSLASNFSLIGLSGNTKITYSGSAAFIGTINAPQAAVTISGGASFYGAMIANTVNISGGGSVHYDDTLGAVGGLIVSSWTEL
jgi:hypothetical protein